ncbi:MAG TPA: hypothetical protein VGQ53_21050 [Chitinophagaceae bacterium]|jgi:hypothetical protein|nr:hypothetical protein [Chitinophagaceae bacterium]
MKEETIIQFVAFETALDSTDFFTQWEQYKRSMDGQWNATLQQHTLKSGKFKYVSQHRCSADEFQFVFQKERRWSKFPEVEVRKKLAGGYSVLQCESVKEAAAGESKILIFIDDYGADLDSFRHFCVHSKLNIYEAYYENCIFTYILEVFVKDEQANDLLQQLEIRASFSEAGIYKELHFS